MNKTEKALLLNYFIISSQPRLPVRVDTYLRAYSFQALSRLARLQVVHRIRLERHYFVTLPHSGELGHLFLFESTRYFLKVIFTVGLISRELRYSIIENPSTARFLGRYNIEY